jgi:hypothetical protein
LLVQSSPQALQSQLSLGVDELLPALEGYAGVDGEGVLG